MGDLRTHTASAENKPNQLVGLLELFWSNVGST